MDNKLKKEILALEKTLMNPETRRDSVWISEILSEDFIEFGISGRVYKYKNGDKFFDTDGRVYEMTDDFSIKKLSENTLIAIYTGKMTKNGKVSYANRSSVWQRSNDSWRLVFHQGTPKK